MNQETNTYIVYPVMQNSGPIVSVYDTEQQAKAQGLIKEMTFVAPVNHEIPLKNKPLAVNKLKSSHRNQPRVTTNSTQGSLIMEGVAPKA